MKRLALAFSIAIAFSVAGAGFIACSDSGDNPVPPDAGPVVIIPGTDVLPPDAPSSAPHQPDGGGADGSASCVAQPVTNQDFLNSCTNGTCFPFPNTKTRLPLLNADGTLPPVP